MSQDCPRRLGPQWSANRAQYKLLKGEASVVCVLSSPPPGGCSLTQTVHSIKQSFNKHRQTTHHVWQALF